MSDIVLIDTSVYLNILDIPGFNQDKTGIGNTFKQRIMNRDYFFLPIATIWETGDHIADLDDGSLRRKLAERFIGDVVSALKGTTPYRPTSFPTEDTFMDLLKAFPDSVMRSKSASKTREGVSLSDLSIIKEWERMCARHSMSHVLIWSLDSDLSGYDRKIP